MNLDAPNLPEGTAMKIDRINDALDLIYSMQGRIAQGIIRDVTDKDIRLVITKHPVQEGPELYSAGVTDLLTGESISAESQHHGALSSAEALRKLEAMCTEALVLAKPCDDSEPAEGAA